MKRLKALIFQLIMLALFAGSALACECALLPMSEQLKISSAIVVASVSKVIGTQAVAISVEKTLKGSVSAELKINLSGKCDYFLSANLQTLVLGEKKLLFLDKQRGGFQVSRCSPSGNLAERTSELAEIKNILAKK